MSRRRGGEREEPGGGGEGEAAFVESPRLGAGTCLRLRRAWTSIAKVQQVCAGEDCGCSVSSLVRGLCLPGEYEYSYTLSARDGGESATDTRSVGVVHVGTVFEFQVLRQLELCSCCLIAVASKATASAPTPTYVGSRHHLGRLGDIGRLL